MGRTEVRSIEQKKTLILHLGRQKCEDISLWTAATD